MHGGSNVKIIWVGREQEGPTNKIREVQQNATFVCMLLAYLT